MSSVDWQSLNWNGFNVQVYKFILWIIIWSRVLRDQVQVFVSLKCLCALSWTLCLRLKSPLACSPRKALAPWAWGWHCGKNRRLSSRMQLFWRTRTALLFLSWNFSTTALGGGQQANEAGPWHPPRVPHSPATSLFDATSGQYKFISRLCIIPKFPQAWFAILMLITENDSFRLNHMELPFLQVYSGRRRRQWHPLQYFCLENPMDGGAWWAAVHGVARVGHYWATSLSLFTFMHWRRKWQPTPVFLPGETQGWGSLVGCRLWGRTESDTTEATQQQQQHSGRMSAI